MQFLKSILEEFSRKFSSVLIFLNASGLCVYSISIIPTDANLSFQFGTSCRKHPLLEGHGDNLSYLGGGNWEDHNSKSAQAKS